MMLYFMSLAHVGGWKSSSLASETKLSLSNFCLGSWICSGAIMDDMTLSGFTYLTLCMDLLPCINHKLVEVT